MDLLSDIKNIIKKYQKEDYRSKWNEYFIALTHLFSLRSPSKRLQVGAVIVKDKRVVSSGYNGFPANTPHVSIMRDTHEQNTIHAEQNAIADAAARGVSIKDSTIYITHYPCINCTKFIIASGIKKIIYSDDYRNDEIVEQLLKNSNIEIEKYSV